MNQNMEAELSADARMDIGTLKWAVKSAWQISPVIFTGWVLMFLGSAVLPVVFMGMISSTVDRISHNVSAGLGMESVAGMLAALATVMIVNGIFMRLPNIMWQKLTNGFNMGMQRKMGEFMQKVPVRYFDDANTARIMSVAQRKDRTLGSFVASLLNMMKEIVYLISLFVLAMKTSWLLAAVLVCYTAVSLRVGMKQAKATYDEYVSVEKDDFYDDYYKNLTMKKNPKDVRLLQMNDYIDKHWKIHRNKLLETDIKVYHKNSKDWSLLKVIATAGKCLLLFAGLFMLRSGMLTLGSLTVFMSILLQIKDECISVGYIWENTYELGCDLKLKKTLFEMDFSKKRPDPEGELPKPQKAREGEAEIIFELIDVSFSYDGTHKVLDHISLCIREGESIALVGENGAGKSTLVKLLLGIYEPDEGELYFRGENYRDLDMSTFVKQIGVVFQDFVHFELLARENIAFGDITRVADDNALNAAAALGGADKVLAKLPKGLDNYLGRWYEKDGGEMSGGEWQRMAVSRAYISDRKILIMDEPAASLDPVAELEQFSHVRQKIDGRTCVLISHRIGFARLADKIVVLKDGRMIESGEHSRLMDKAGLYYEMFTSQASWYQEGVV